MLYVIPFFFFLSEGTHTFRRLYIIYYIYTEIVRLLEAFCRAEFPNTKWHYSAPLVRPLYGPPILCHRTINCSVDMKVYWTPFAGLLYLDDTSLCRDRHCSVSPPSSVYTWRGFHGSSGTVEQLIAIPSPRIPPAIAFLVHWLAQLSKSAIAILRWLYQLSCSALHARSPVPSLYLSILCSANGIALRLLICIFLFELCVCSIKFMGFGLQIKCSKIRYCRRYQCRNFTDYRIYRGIGIFSTLRKWKS